VFEKCSITKYLCAFCGDNHCGIGVIQKDKITKKQKIVNDLKLMNCCPKEKEEKGIK